MVGRYRRGWEMPFISDVDMSGGAAHRGISVPRGACQGIIPFVFSYSAQLPMLDL